MASLVLALALFAGSGVGVHSVGWAAASVVPILLIALFRRRAQRRLLEVGVALTPMMQSLATLLVVGGLVAAGWHAWFIASELA